jgi:hypothetical protein
MTFWYSKEERSRRKGIILDEFEMMMSTVG